MEISVCIIAKNESEVIGRCLECAKRFADEIIVVDTGSEDETKSIAKKYTDKVYDFKWIDDFSAARNFSFSKATKDYIMWLDCDDIIEDNDIVKIMQLKKENKASASVYYFKYDVSFDEQGNSTFSYFRERLVRKQMNPVWVEPIHEVIYVSGNSEYREDIHIKHKKLKSNPPKRNLKIFRNLIKNNIKMSTRLKFYYARELMYNKYYKKAIKEFDNFLKEPDAFVENQIEACLNLSECYLNIKQSDNALQCLFKSFKYDLPRAKVCCKVANILKNNGKLENAAFWYNTALTLKIDKFNLGFVEKDYYNYIPAIELCVIYDKLGNKILAKSFNDLAGSIKPNDKAYLFNKEYFIKNGIL